MITNALLIRWQKGWHEVVSLASVAVHGRREGLLALGAAGSLAEVETIAWQQLAIFGDPREAIALDYAPMGPADTPYLSFEVGDRITVPASGGGTSVERVLAMTVTEDEQGNVSYAPELKDIIAEDQERIAETIKKMSDGTLAGQAVPATSAASLAGTAGPTCCAPIVSGGTT